MCLIPTATLALPLALLASAPGARLVAAPARGVVGAGLRIRQRIDGGWRFQRVTAGPSSSVQGVPVTGWRWASAQNQALNAATVSDPVLDSSGGAWKDANVGDDVFGGARGSAWFTALLGAGVGETRGKAPAKIHFEAVDDNAEVYLNGTLLGRHEGWDEPFDVSTGSGWRVGAPNRLAVLVENTAGAGGLVGPVTLVAGAAQVLALAPVQAAADFNASSWEVVHLPHDYVVENAFDPKSDGSHGFKPSGAAWYRKTIVIPASARGKRVWLDFDGVYRDSKVYLNGVLVSQHPCGYTGFQADLSSAARYGAANQVAVFTDARKPEGWWYEGGGIYRHVTLNIAGPVRVATYGTLVTAQVKGLGAGETPSATLTIKTTLSNQTARPVLATLSSIVTRPNGSAGPTSTNRVLIPANGSIEVAQPANDPNAALWSLERPQLYHLRSVVSVGGKPVDSYDTPFGVRSIRFDNDRGFLLNEKPVKIQGTCNHQDFAGLGVALPDGILAWRIARLKAMGSNAYRTSHNEVASELLDECDRQGMLVMDEARHFGDGEAGKASENTPAETHENLRQQVLRDRNHPSVIMWSIGNEEGAQGSAGGLRIGTAMKSLITQLDGSRPVTEAVNSRHEEGSATILDLLGVNYNPGLYDAHRKHNPAQPVFGSETASALSTRGVYATDAFEGAGVTQHGDPANSWVAAYDLNRPGWGQTAQDAWRPIAERPFNAGGFVWTGFDYRGEPTPFGWPAINSAFGILDMCGFPKDSYYYYQSVWGTKPMVHVLPHWNWAGREGQPIEVWAYSNADQVELLLNGASLGTKEMPKNGHASWSVPYAPGTLTARAMTAGKLIATDEVVTTGAPAAIRLKTDRPALIADGEDASPVEVEIVDARGRVVPNAGNLVRFSVSGAGIIAGVGNGNPSSHESDKAPQRSAFNGLCMAIVRAAEAPGSATLTAQSEGLKPATLRLSVGR